MKNDNLKHLYRALLNNSSVVAFEAINKYILMGEGGKFTSKEVERCIITGYDYKDVIEMLT